MEDEYEYSKSNKKTKSKAKHRTGNTTKHRNTPWSENSSDRIIFYQWIYDEFDSEYTVNPDAIDTFDLQCGELVYLESKNRWEIPKLARYCDFFH
jgi:hypothetical protein